MFHRWIVFAAVAQTACSDLPAIEYETEHLRLATQSEARVCQGSLDDLEAHVIWVEAQLGVEMSEPVEIYIGEDLVDSECREKYGDHTGGCYERRGHRIFTDWTGAPHELVHAVAAQMGAADEFYAEGTATAFSGDWTAFGYQAPTLGVGLTANDVEYNAAAHFVRWLHEREGAAPLRDLLDQSSPFRGPKHAEKAFERAYGQSLLDAEIEFYADAPEQYPSPRPCQVPALDWSDDRIEADVELDCDASDTYGSGALFVARTLTIPADGHYVLELKDPAQAIVRVCRDEVVPLGAPAPPQPVSPVGDLRGGNAWIPFGWIEAGAHDLYLYEGRYRIDVRLPSDGVTHLRLHRKLSGGTPAD